MFLNRREMITTSAVLAMGFAVGCGRRPESVLRVGTVPWRGFEPLFIARERGYFENTIQIVEYPGTPNIHRSFQNHAIEAATVTLDEALQLAQTQPDVRVIMAIDFSNGADALLCKPEIISLADLKGKRIGAELNSFGAFILSRVLERADLLLADVTVVPLSIEQTESSFLSDEVDAVITCEPFSSRLQTSGATVLFDSAQMPGEIVDVLIVREKTLRSHPRALANLLSGWFRAVEVFREQPNDTASRAADQGITADEFLGIHNRVELLDHSRNLALLKMPGGGLADTVRKLGASMKKYALLNEMIDPARLLDSTILKQVTP
ncbi:MAG: ABC transporter substrate-binding protein [Verrucomicrobia bacterium]|nr:ABC transporter substrate-binding protein [Verrucomicrobiota bacterium]